MIPTPRLNGKLPARLLWVPVVVLAFAVLVPLAACSSAKPAGASITGSQRTAPVGGGAAGGAAQLPNMFAANDPFDTTRAVSPAVAMSQAATGLVLPDPAIVGTAIKALADPSGLPKGDIGVSLLYSDGVFVNIIPIASYQDNKPWDMQAAQKRQQAELDSFVADGGGFTDGRKQAFVILTINGRPTAVWTRGTVIAAKGGPPSIRPGYIEFTTDVAEYWVYDSTVPKSSSAAASRVTSSRLLDFARAVR